MLLQFLPILLPLTVLLFQITSIQLFSSRPLFITHSILRKIIQKQNYFTLKSTHTRFNLYKTVNHKFISKINPFGMESTIILVPQHNNKNNT